MNAFLSHPFPRIPQHPTDSVVIAGPKAFHTLTPSFPNAEKGTSQRGLVSFAHSLENLGQRGAFVCTPRNQLDSSSVGDTEGSLEEELKAGDVQQLLALK